MAVFDQSFQLSALLYVWVIRSSFVDVTALSGFADVLSRDISRPMIKFSMQKSYSLPKETLDRCQHMYRSCLHRKNRNELLQDFYGYCIDFWAQTQLRRRKSGVEEN